MLFKVTIWDNKLQLSLFYTHLFCGVLVSVITMWANQRLQKSIYYFSTKHAIHLEEIARTRWFSLDNVSEWSFLSSCIHSAIKKGGLIRGVASFEVDSLKFLVHLKSDLIGEWSFSGSGLIRGGTTVPLFQ